VLASGARGGDGAELEKAEQVSRRPALHDPSVAEAHQRLAVEDERRARLGDGLEPPVVLAAWMEPHRQPVALADRVVSWQPAKAAHVLS
jgi:hypothetical protein